ncbi:adrenocorticotropic hormone receptor-like [Oculina patagonica]
MFNHTNQSNDPKSGNAENYAGFFIVGVVLHTMSSLIAFTGNFVVLGAIWRTPSLHQPSYVLLFGLALSDLGVGLIVQPMLSAGLIYELRTGIKLPYLWIVFRTLQAIFISATILTLTSVSVDKCLALLLHLRYVAVVTVKKTVNVLGLIWVTSVLCSVTLVLGGKIYPTISMFLVAFCIVVNISTCSTIYRICRRHRIQIQDQAMAQQNPEAFDMKRYRKSLTTMIVLLSLLIICYAPYICTRVVAYFANWSSGQNSFIQGFSASLVYLNSSINPLVYCWRLPEMRAPIKKFWKSLFCGLV